MQTSTQKEIARRLNVSQALVSRILGGKRPVRSKIHHHILEEGSKLGYLPNHAALSLKTGQRRTWGLIFPSFYYLGEFNRLIIQGIWEVACENQRSLSVASVDSPVPGAADYLRLIREGRFDGIFVVFDNRHADIPFDEIRRSGIPVIAVNCPLPGDTIQYIYSDADEGICRGVKHLIQVHGRRRIAYVVRHEDSYLMEDRYRGYCRGLKEAGLEVDPDLVYCPREGFSYEESGQTAVREFEKKGIRYDAVCCSSDYFACGVIGALSDRGIRVPEDVSVVGFDDSAMAKMVRPQLTTVACDGVAMGRHAGRMLMDVFQNPESPLVQSFKVPTTLVVRRSCGCGG